MQVSSVTEVKTYLISFILILLILLIALKWIIPGIWKFFSKKHLEEVKILKDTSDRLVQSNIHLADTVDKGFKRLEATMIKIVTRVPLIIFLLLSHCWQDSFTITTYKDIETKASITESIEVKTDMPVLTKPVEKVIEKSGIEIKGKPSKIKIQLVRECHPKCDKLETCNTDKGTCEGMAKSFKWSPKDEHSAVFFVDSSKLGNFDPKFDEYQGGF